MMRYAIAAAALMAAAVPASAGDKMKNAASEAPTLMQCQEGWKDSYSAKWTEAQFKTACDTILKN